MKNNMLLLSAILSLCIVIESASAQTRKYERKSITSLGSVLFKAGIGEKVSADLVSNRMKYYLEVPRFDYNQISADAVKDFVTEANKTDLSAPSIAGVLDRTIIPQIKQVLEAVREMRAKGNMKEEDMARAAVDKMKGSGLTVEDIVKVMNSAYVYLPVVTSYNEATKDNVLSAVVRGYVLWYKLVFTKDGKMNATLLDNSKSEQIGMGDGTIGSNYSLKRRNVDGKEYAKIIAVNTWAKNLGVAMKDITDFKLSGEIKGVEGIFVDANLGRKEGINLDEGYNAIEEFEDRDGSVKNREAGFYRVDNIADNRQSEGNSSRFQRYLGGAPERGMLMLERPRLGIDLEARAKFFTLKIPKYATPKNWNFYLLDVIDPAAMGDNYYLLSDDATTAFGVDLNFSLNIAKYLQIRQLFLNLDLAVGMPNVSINQNAAGSATVAPLLISAYVGPMKKIWFGNMNVSVAACIGADLFNMTTTGMPSGGMEDLKLYSLGAKVDIGWEMLLTSDISVKGNVGYKIGLSPITATTKFGTDEYDISTLTQGSQKLIESAYFKDLNFSGINISAGISFALPSLPFDPFPALTAQEIDY
jgi:hypothetical protein